MARTARIALDLVLVSLKTVRPAVAKVWFMTKKKIESSRAEKLVDNIVIEKLETVLDKICSLLELKIIEVRDKQLLPKELKYLESEIEKIKKRIGTNVKPAKTGLPKKGVTEHLTPKIATAWQYAKFEMAPPMTIGFFHGPLVRKLEDYCSNTANNFKAGLRQQIKEIDAEEERVRKEKEAAAAMVEEEHIEASEEEAETPEKPPEKK